ncbi:MAG TPA: oxidoreductase, partial [Burkholderiaceae bacterium]|nr:oxidoreductase [Burkholderiaceae bacterium]
RAGSNDWVSLHRNYDATELAGGTRDVNGTNELLMRNQFRAWVTFMTRGMED